MNSVGQSGDKKSLRVILLLVVGLTAFSSAMKELNQLREFTRDASGLVASLSNAVAPSQPVEKLAPIDVPRTAVRLEACDANDPQPAHVQVDVGVAPQPGSSVESEQGAKIKLGIKDVGTKDVGKTVVATRMNSRPERRGLHIAESGKHRVEDIEMIKLRGQARRLSDLRLTIMAGGENGSEIAIPASLELKLPKVKNQRQIIINQAERDAFLKNLSRGLNLRSAG